MQLRQKTRRNNKRKVMIVLVGVAIMAGAAGVYLYFGMPRHAAVEPPKSPAIAQPQPQQKSQPIAIALPNATPIVPLKENYNADSSVWHVVSKDYPLTDAHYVPVGLELATVPARTDKTAAERSLRTDIMPAVEQLFGAMKTAGYDMMIGSGYRSYDLQTMYFNNYAKANGAAAANQFSALPGQSEHQTGLAFDIGYQNSNCYVNECFGDTPAGQWIAAHSFEYGFIVRYPKDKTAITKYNYEPWHLRYVGKELATALHQSGLTLDEARPYLQTALQQLIADGTVKA